MKSGGDTKGEIRGSESTNQTNNMTRGRTRRTGKGSNLRRRGDRRSLGKFSSQKKVETKSRVNIISVSGVVPDVLRRIGVLDGRRGVSVKRSGHRKNEKEN